MELLSFTHKGYRGPVLEETFEDVKVCRMVLGMVRRAETEITLKIEELKDD